MAFSGFYNNDINTNLLFLTQVLNWYRTTGHAQLQRTELGDSYEGARQIQADHQQFEHQARVSEAC